MSSKAKIWMYCSLGIFILLAATIGGYIAYFSLQKKALPGTMVGNVAVVGKNEAQIAAQLKNAQDNVKVTFTGAKNADSPVSLAEIGYKVDEKKTAKQAMQLNKQPLNFVTGLFTTHKVEPVYIVEAEKTSALAKKYSQGIPGAKDAIEPSIKQVEGEAKFQVMPGKDGYGVTKKSLIAGADKALQDQKDTQYAVEVDTSSPLVSNEEANGIADRAQQLASSNVSVQVGDNTSTAEPKTVASWVRFPKIQKDAKPDLDEGAVAKWLDEVKKPIEAKRVDGFRYKNKDGKILLVQKEAKDGVVVGNLKEVSQAIKKDLVAGKEYQGKLETQVDKSKWEEKVIADGAEKLIYKAGPGEKWIDVNLSNHTLTGYEGATVVKGPIPIVNGKPSTPTVVGQYKIGLRYRSQTMRGSDYVTPNVPYVQYFHGGYAIHGAYWRSSFGYAGPSGSHGCVNISVEDAKDLWNWSDVGTTVITHN